MPHNNTRLHSNTRLHNNTQLHRLNSSSLHFDRNNYHTSHAARILKQITFIYSYSCKE
uniref:Uncharacterized protein n=1 Tax=Arion vulgaris TaxID=1028688 RepID=A0A0B6Y778_9EUPU